MLLNAYSQMLDLVALLVAAWSRTIAASTALVVALVHRKCLDSLSVGDSLVTTTGADGSGVQYR